MEEARWWKQTGKDWMMTQQKGLALKLKQLGVLKGWTWTDRDVDGLKNQTRTGTGASQGSTHSSKMSGPDSVLKASDATLLFWRVCFLRPRLFNSPVSAYKSSCWAIGSIFTANGKEVSSDFIFLFWSSDLLERWWGLISTWQSRQNAQLRR